MPANTSNPSIQKGRGRPRLALTEEQRVERRRALERARSYRHYHQQQALAITPIESRAGIHHNAPHLPALPSTTDPVIGLHIEPNISIPVPAEEPPAPRPVAELPRDQQDALQCDRPVWNPTESARTIQPIQPTQDDSHKRNCLFENSRTQFEIVSKGGEAVDAVVLESQANAEQNNTRDEELQSLANTVDQLLISPHNGSRSGWLSVVLI
jgi:hypothetical protein